MTAWEGLQKFYEKQKPSAGDNSDHYELVLQKLLHFYHSDVSKFYEVSTKLSQIQLERKDLDGAVETLQKQAEKCQELIKDNGN